MQGKRFRPWGKWGLFSRPNPVTFPNNHFSVSNNPPEELAVKLSGQQPRRTTALLSILPKSDHWLF